MPRPPHVEKHFTASETVRDIVIGMSDGLTVPFALAAGLSGAVDPNANWIVVTAGLAEVAAGSIAMGLGGYLAARTDAEHYASELAREERETVEMPDEEEAEVAQVFRGYGLPEGTVNEVVRAISSDRRRWVDFMMRFELGLEEPDPRRARRSALTIALSYIAGGMIPLAPYFFLSVHQGLIASVVVTLLALLVFGYVKGRATTPKPLRSAWQTAVVGALAAAAAFGIARLVEVVGKKPESQGAGPGPVEVRRLEARAAGRRHSARAAASSSISQRICSCSTASRWTSARATVAPSSTRWS
jgi:VIT1/CCC1 family predicted Fe2+/Mn2+ transporter